MNYRGSSGVKMTSPVLFGSGDYDDVLESIEYVFQEYCREIDRKIFVIGFSLGGNWLGMSLGKHQNGLRDRIVAATLWQSPTKLKASTKNLTSCLGGLINSNLGNKHKKVLLKNMQYLYPMVKQIHNLDLKKFC